MTDLQLLVEKLDKRFKLLLPGLDSQLIMASRKRVNFKLRTGLMSSARPSGVLLLLYPKDGEICFILMRRPDYTGVHSGQISLPGGKFEPGDSDLVATAIREAKEEVGD